MRFRYIFATSMYMDRKHLTLKSKQNLLDFFKNPVLILLSSLFYFFKLENYNVKPPVAFYLETFQERLFANYFINPSRIESSKGSFDQIMSFS